MRNTIGGILVGLGLLSLLMANMNARRSPDVSYLMGSFLPGVVLMLLGLVLRREWKGLVQSPTGAGDAHIQEE